MNLLCVRNEAQRCDYLEWDGKSYRPIGAILENYMTAPALESPEAKFRCFNDAKTGPGFEGCDFN